QIHVENAKKFGTAFITLADLERHAEGLICLTGGHEGPIARLFLDNQKDSIDPLVKTLGKYFSGRLYIELMRHGLPVQQQLEPLFLEIADKYKLPLVATNDCMFVDPDMYEAHDALLCIAGGNYVSQADR